jgi:protein disulfide-isomerase-like protein
MKQLFLFSLFFQLVSSKVVELDEEKFTNYLSNSAKTWIVEFYAPWCAHCKALAPIFEEAARKESAHLNFGAVNCEVSKQLCKEYGVTGYPTIYSFPSKTPIENLFQEKKLYRGMRTLHGFSNFAKRASLPQVHKLPFQTIAQVMELMHIPSICPTPGTSLFNWIDQYSDPESKAAFVFVPSVSHIEANITEEEQEKRMRLDPMYVSFVEVARTNFDQALFGKMTNTEMVKVIEKRLHLKNIKRTAISGGDVVPSPVAEKKKTDDETESGDEFTIKTTSEDEVKLDDPTHDDQPLQITSSFVMRISVNVDDCTMTKYQNLPTVEIAIISYRMSEVKLDETGILGKNAIVTELVGPSATYDLTQLLNDWIMTRKFPVVSRLTEESFTYLARNEAKKLLALAVLPSNEVPKPGVSLIVAFSSTVTNKIRAFISFFGTVALRSSSRVDLDGKRHFSARNVDVHPYLSSSNREKFLFAIADLNVVRTILMQYQIEFNNNNLPTFLVLDLHNSQYYPLQFGESDFHVSKMLDNVLDGSVSQVHVGAFAPVKNSQVLLGWWFYPVVVTIILVFLFIVWKLVLESAFTSSPKNNKSD